MKTIKYIALAVILFGYPSIISIAQSGSVVFCETYTQEEVFSKLDPEDKLFKLIITEGTDPGSSRIGSCLESGMEDLLEYVRSDSFRDKVQADLKLVPGVVVKDQGIPVFAIRKSPADQVFPEPGDVEEVSVNSSDNRDDYSLLITFSESGTEKWASMTRLNKGRDIAMLFEGKVVSAPRVQEEITQGKCMISGKFTESEINSLKATLEH